ncbi:hypothetical protein [Chelatococcus reniformis]|uniref:Uncharacterized protein n=1 Tax=Chelatococcus reniformis TaxID=1494448 RepID=A0A916UCE8_9HYPH|nr:hypothetical protein [Chelatococcus reniformis]GGC67731.1 hypothetical protein GCM10010994_27920 [Chelatococcus reniformis]
MSDRPSDHELIELALIAPYFDATYYLARNPDVETAGMDAALHYLRYGWREGRNPSPRFDAELYLRLSPDVAAADVNPLVHYATVGRQEGRPLRRRWHSYRQTLEAASPPHERAAAMAEEVRRHPDMDEGELIAALRAESAAALVVATSHDDYAENIGGVQKLIGEEQAAFESHGWSYLHLCPVRHRVTLAPPSSADAFVFRARLSGRALGTVDARAVTGALARFAADGCTVDFVVHHLMGHAPEVLTQLFTAVPDATPTFWLHDSFGICPNFNLTRNDVSYCGAPPSDSMACRLCVYGRARIEHLRRVDAFLLATRPRLLAPSESALARWLDKRPLPHAGTRVVELARLCQAPEPFTPSTAQPLKVAHLGARIASKGWNQFDELARRLMADARYEFYQLGYFDGSEPHPAIHHVSVSAGMAAPDRMVTTMAELGIDVVVSWSQAPETFCFTVHEALAAGAFVVAKYDAGNIWPAVQRNAPGQGFACTDWSDLLELFASGSLLALAAAPRRRGILLDGENTAHDLIPRRMRAGKARLASASAVTAEDAHA